MCRAYTIARSCGHLEIQDAPKGIIPCPSILQSRKSSSEAKETVQSGCVNLTNVRIPSWQACRVCIEELWGDVPGLLSTPDSQVFDEGSVEGIRESANSTDDETRDQKSSNDSRASSTMGELRNIHMKVVCNEVSLDDLADAMDASVFGRSALLPSLPVSTGDSFDLSCAILSPRPCIVAMPSLDDLVANAATMRKSIAARVPESTLTVAAVKGQLDIANTATQKPFNGTCGTKLDDETARPATPIPSQNGGDTTVLKNENHPVKFDTPLSVGADNGVADDNEGVDDNDVVVVSDEIPSVTAAENVPIEDSTKATVPALPGTTISSTNNTVASASNSPTSLTSGTSIVQETSGPATLPQSNTDNSAPEDPEECGKSDISNGWCMVQVVEPIDLGEDVVTVPTPYWDPPVLSSEDVAVAMSAESHSCSNSLGIYLPLPKILKFMRPV